MELKIARNEAEAAALEGAAVGQSVCAALSRDTRRHDAGKAESQWNQKLSSPRPAPP